jgi:hypothetical protein
MFTVFIFMAFGSSEYTSLCYLASGMTRLFVDVELEELVLIEKTSSCLVHLNKKMGGQKICHNEHFADLSSVL